METEWNEMGWNWMDEEDSKSLEKAHIKFSYQEQQYQELKYSADFDFETFVSNIGGFVGIFLGYSMMQFPQLLGNSLI